METRDGLDETTLHRGTDGAVLVMAVFFACFVVGMLYYCIGLGEACLVRERMQDAADAAAFSAAVVDARGMNLIALANVVMAAALAVLIALRAAELLAAGAAALAFVTGATGDADALLAVQDRVRALYSASRAPVETVLRLGHRASVAVRDGTPSVARGRALASVEPFVARPALATFAYLPSDSLPVEDAPYAELCAHAHARAVPWTAEFFAALPLSARVRAYVDSNVAAATRDAADSVCPVELPSGTTDRASERVRPGLHLGTEPFIVRGFAVGAIDLDQHQRFVRAANRFRPPPAGSDAALVAIARMGDVAYAQTEFYPAGPGARDASEWLWSSEWRARFRRFTPPPMVGPSALCEACEASGAGDTTVCGRAEALDFGLLAGASLH